MANDIQTLRNLQRALFDRAERWNRAATIFKILGVGLGAFVVLTGMFPVAAPAIPIILSLLAWGTAWRAGIARGMADSLLNKLDMADSFGWKISDKELSDLWVDIPKWLEQQLPKFEMGEYFASQQPVGAKRTVENIQESAWWSKHLAKRVGLIYVTSTVIVLAISVILLIVSMRTIKIFDQLDSIARAATSVIIFMLSGGIAQLAQKYLKFSKKASRIENRTVDLLKGDITEIEAIKLTYEYQIARGTAPQIPGWIYKWMREELNRLWETYRK